jgi:hypothetical protein
MVDVNEPRASSAQAGTSVSDGAIEQPPSGAAAEAEQEKGQALAERTDQASAESAVAATASSLDVTPGPFSAKTLKALRDLSFTHAGPQLKGPENSRVGAHILLNWDGRGSWILDRTDSFVISAEGWRSREFTVYLTSPEIPAPGGEGYFLPLETFPLYSVREVIASDEDGNRLPALSSVEQRSAIGSAIVAFASTIVNDGQTMLPEASQTTEYLRSAARARGTLQLHRIKDENHRKALQGSAEFVKLAEYLLAHEFLCVRRTWDGNDGRPHAVHVTYQQAVESGPQPSGNWLQRTAATLGIGAIRLKVALPPARTAQHWRFVITAPIGAELYGCRLIGGRSGDREAADFTEGRQTAVQFDPDDDYKSLDIEFRISRQWRTWVLVNALLITLLLAVGAWRISFVAQSKSDLGTKDLTAAFLLGINGAFAGILARPTDDALTSTYLSGIRFAISILGILAFAAVATLAFGPSGDALFPVWLAFASLAGFVFLLVLIGSGFWERR